MMKYYYIFVISFLVCIFNIPNGFALDETELRSYYSNIEIRKDEVRTMLDNRTALLHNGSIIHPYNETEIADRCIERAKEFYPYLDVSRSLIDECVIAYEKQTEVSLKITNDSVLYDPHLINGWCFDKLQRSMNHPRSIEPQEAYSCVNVYEDKRDRGQIVGKDFNCIIRGKCVK